MKINIGDSTEITRVIDDKDVLEFAKLSNDYNPIHFEDNAARKQGYEYRIVHGLLIGNLFSRLIGTELPGDGSIYMSQTLLFERPIYVGETVRIVVTVKTIEEYNSHLIFRLNTQCFNEKERIAVDGEARVMLRKENND